jgi:class 3 adenylate cyclase/tetratricopeptide (TPR) repeat protein
MADSIQEELDRLQAALAGLEAQRSLLGEAIVQPALDSLNEKIAALQAQLQPARTVPGEQTPQERRIVTALFSDVVGSTTLASQYDPEEWHEIMAAVHGLAGGLIHQHEGRVMQYLGDGLLALFGAEAADESDAEQALRAALAIQAALPGLANDHSLPLRHPLQMRIGIHTGLVMIGEYQSATKTELSASGDAMNVAARLQSAAPPGGVLITHDTYRYVRETFELQAQPPLSVKGKSESLRTYLVLARRPAGFRNLTRGVAGVASPTVGRQAELSQLREAYRQTVEQGAACWLQITGEPGIGKSRLLEEMGSYFPQHTPVYTLLKARCYPGGQQQAYAAVRRMWMDHFYIPEDALAEELEARWLAGFTQTPCGMDEEQLGEASRALGYLIGLPVTPPSSAPKAEELKGQAMVLSHRLFAALRQAGPLVMLLEDVHWLDPSSRDYFLELLKGSCEGTENLPGQACGAVYILATARPEWAPPPDLLASPAYREMALMPLSSVDCESLTRTLLKEVSGVPEAVIRRVIERAEGIPYYVEEMVNWFLDLGVIDQTTQPWQFVGEKFKPTLLPSTLQHLLQSRLDHLQPDEKKLLQVGAVLGRRFWEGWLETGLGQDSEAGCHECLLALEPTNFILQQTETAFDGQVEWSFYHQMQQEVAYASLLKRQRRSLHRAAAGWLEMLAGKAGRLEAHAGTIGEHCLEAGDLEGAAGWFQRAGVDAQERGALLEARQYYERALELLPESDLETRWQASLLLDEVIGLLSDTPARLAEDERLVALAGQIGREDTLAVAYARQGNYLSYLGDHRRAVPLLRQAHQHALQSGDLAIACQALGMLAIGLVALGRLDEAEECAGQVLELANRCGDRLTLAMSLTNLSNYYAMLGNHYQASQLINQQVALTREMKHRLGELRGLNNLGYEYVRLGMIPIGTVTLENACELADTYGLPRDAAYARLNLGLAYLRQDEFQAACGVLQRALKSLDEAGDRYGLAAGQVYLGLAYERHAEPLAAQECFQQAQQISGELKLTGTALDSLAGLARQALALGRLAKAASYNQELWPALDASHTAGMEFPMLAYQTCAMVFEQSGEAELAARAVFAANDRLAANASRISDPNWREVYLHNIPENEWITQKAAALPPQRTQPVANL